MTNVSSVLKLVKAIEKVETSSNTFEDYVFGGLSLMFSATDDSWHLSNTDGEYLLYNTTLGNVAEFLRKRLQTAEKHFATVTHLTIGGYNSKVSSEGIVVGCSSFTFEDFDELAKAVAKARS